MSKILLFFIFVINVSFGQDSEQVLIRKNPPWFRGEVSKKKQFSCSTVDLIDKSGPVRNQTHGSCYAYAAMELLNFNKTPVLSALYLAELVGSQDKSPFKRKEKFIDQIQGLNGGAVETALKVGLRTALCPEEYVSSVNEQDDNYETVLEFYQVAKDSHLNKEELLCAMENDQFKNAITAIFPNYSIISFLQNFDNSNSVSEFAEKMSFTSCQGHLLHNLNPNKKMTVTSAYFDDDKKQTAGVYRTKQRDMIDHLDKSLLFQTPVAISILSSGLLYPFSSKEQQHDNHAAVIMGRKWLEEKKNENGEVIQRAGCYYLAKNSWGEDWKVPDNAKAKNVEGHPGYFMVSEDDLLGHLYRTISLEEATSDTLDSNMSPAGPK